MAQRRAQQQLKIVITIQAMQAAGIGSGSDTVRRFAVNEFGFPDEFPSTQDGNIGGSVFVRKVAAHAISLPKVPPKPLQNGMTSGSDLMGKVAVNAAGLPEEFLKTMEYGNIGRNGMVRRAALDSAGPLVGTTPMQDSNVGGNIVVRKSATNASVEWHGGMGLPRTDATNDSTLRRNGVLSELASFERSDFNKATRVSQEADFKSTGENKASSNNIHESFPKRLTPRVQIRNADFTMAVLTAKASFFLPFLMFLLCSCIVLLAPAFYGKIQSLRSNREQQDLALLELRLAAQQAAQHALQSQEDHDWRQVLTKMSELRAKNFNRNHPLYGIIEAHMGELGIQDQLQSLFTELSEGETLLTVEQLNLVLSNFHFAATNLTTGSIIFEPFYDFPVWLTSVVQQPVTFTMFISIFVLFLVVRMQGGIILQRGDGSTQTARGENLWHLRIDYGVEIRGRIAYKASFTFGNFERVGATAFMDREVTVQHFSSGS